MRQLFCMARGKRREEWEHSSWTIAAIASMFGKRRIDPRKINPFVLAEAGEEEPIEVGIHEFAKLFVEGAAPRKE